MPHAQDTAGPPLDRVGTTVCAVPADEPGADGNRLTVVLVEAAAAGTTGLGRTYGDPAVAALAADLLAPAVTGLGAHGVPAAHAAMARALGATGGLPGAAALSAVDIAIGEARGRAPQRDLGRVHVAREIVGPRCERYVDADGGYSVKQAVRITALLADDGVSWFEEPVPAGHLTGLRQARDAVAGAHGLEISGTAPRTPRRTRPPPCPTCGTSSGPTTGRAPRASSSTASSTRRAAPPCRARPEHRATASSSGPTRSCATASPDAPSPVRPAPHANGCTRGTGHPADTPG
ncbi:enolase C-terminal domain-like protein [Streptomyces sp. NPDC047002]|uniref:enolase C-terminal domain-like protein n=1 Tax=Streptomyces sp. NPDC047002 TaxID=3155475 RepID=UPI0034559C27